MPLCQTALDIEFLMAVIKMARETTSDFRHAWVFHAVALYASYAIFPMGIYPIHLYSVFPLLAFICMLSLPTRNSVPGMAFFLGHALAAGVLALRFAAVSHTHVVL